MRILFIYTEISNVDKQHYYLGLGSIIAMLEQHGHKCRLLCFYDEPDISDLIQKIGDFEFDLAGITSNWLQWKYVKQIAGWLKGIKDIPIICGGCMATFETKTVISHDAIDIACVGYGEYAMLELADRLQHGRAILDIQNLWVMRAGRIYKNSLRPLPDDIDEMPFPSREHVDFQKLLNKTDYTATVSAGRGCVNSCAFCANASLKKMYRKKGPPVSKHSPRYVVDEIKSLLASYPLKRLFFEDEDFVHTREWTRAFCDLYSKEVALPFMIGYSITRADEETLEMLRNAGCQWVGYGVESGNEWMRMHILNKKVSNRDVINTFELTKRVGLHPIATVMIGLPDETPETVQETIDFLYRIKPYFTLPMTYYPIPETELYEVCKSRNMISERVTDRMNDGDSILDLPGISADELRASFSRLCDVNLDIMIKETNSGYLSLIDKIHSEKMVALPPCIQITIDWWKNIFDNQPILHFLKSGEIEMQVRVKADSVLKFGVGFQRDDNALDCIGIVDYSVEIFSDFNVENFAQTVEIDAHENKNLYYEYNSIDLSGFSESLVNIRFSINRNSINNSVNTFYLNPYLIDAETV